MNSIETIQRICNLPSEFRSGSKSAYELVHDSGIDARSLTPESVSAVLLPKPELVSDWLDWSENKRSTPGYYFLAEEGGLYIVGYYPGDTQFEFSDPIAACADYVVKEVNSIW